MLGRTANVRALLLHLQSTFGLFTAQQHVPIRDGGTPAPAAAAPFAAEDKAVKHVSSHISVIHTFAEETEVNSLANGPKNVFYFKGSRDINNSHYGEILLAGRR